MADEKLTYNDKKQEFMNKKDVLLRNYEALFLETMQLGSELNHFFDDINVTIDEYHDYYETLVDDENVDKVMRLMVALQYVEFPNDKEIISNLKQNIKINSCNNKRKK